MWVFVGPKNRKELNCTNGTQRGPDDLVVYEWNESWKLKQVVTLKKPRLLDFLYRNVCCLSVRLHETMI